MSAGSKFAPHSPTTKGEEQNQNSFDYAAMRKIGMSVFRKRGITNPDDMDELIAELGYRLWRFGRKDRVKNVFAYCKSVANSVYCEWHGKRLKEDKYLLSNDESGSLAREDGNAYQVQDISCDPETVAVWKVTFEGVTSNLTENEKKVLELYCEGYTSSQIAEELGYGSPGAVRVVLHRMRPRLRRLHWLTTNE